MVLVIMKLVAISVLLLTVTLNSVLGANILIIVPLASHSHHFWNRVLTLELAKRGHTVTVVTPDLEKKPVPNVTELYLDGSYSYTEEDFDLVGFQNLGVLDTVDLYFVWGESVCAKQMNSTGAKKLLQYPNEKVFDLIVFELALNECFLPFIEKFGYPPTIGVSAFGNILTTSYVFGSPEPFAYAPSVFLPYTDKMTFTERLTNTLISLYTMYYRQYVYLPKMQKMSNEAFGYEVSPLEEIERKISMILVNNIIGVDYTKPVVPSIVSVGGLHLKPSEKLPQDLQEYLDNAKDGAILFSLGSNLRSDKLDDNARELIMSVFKELPQKVLWKFESESLPGKPDNVKISKWLPQSAILAHPNLKLFITHCGSLSTQEAMYRGVPIVGLPFFLDQHINLHRSKAMGIGEGFKFSELTRDKLQTAIKNVLSNKTYTDNVKRLSTIFHDQPEHPLECAVFWTEYVLRHNGAPHLKSAALDLEWYQYFLLDVIAAILIAIIISLWICAKIIKSILKLFVKKKKVKQN